MPLEFVRFTRRGEAPNMRNKIFGGIGVIWGGAMVLNWLGSDAPASGSAAYQGGQTGAAVFGALMLVAGLYYFFKKPKQA